MSKAEPDTGDDDEQRETTHGTSRCWETSRKIETTVPSGRVDRHHLHGSRIVAFTPVLVDGIIQFDIDTNPDHAGTQAHHRRLHKRHPEEYDMDQIVARFPREMGRAVNLTNPRVVTEDDGRTLHWQSTGQHRLRVRPEPEIGPWMPSDITTVGEVVAEDVRSLVPLHREDSEETLQLALNLPKPFVDDGGIEAGDVLATRVTARDGEIALALDREVGDDEVDEPYVRRVFKQTHGPDQWTTYVSKQFMDALGWTESPLQLTLEPAQIIIQPAGGDHDGSVDQ